MWLYLVQYNPTMAPQYSPELIVEGQDPNEIHQTQKKLMHTPLKCKEEEEEDPKNGHNITNQVDGGLHNIVELLLAISF